MVLASIFPALYQEIPEVQNTTKLASLDEASEKAVLLYEKFHALCEEKHPCLARCFPLFEKAITCNNGLAAFVQDHPRLSTVGSIASGIGLGIGFAASKLSFLAICGLSSYAIHRLLFSLKDEVPLLGTCKRAANALTVEAKKLCEAKLSPLVDRILRSQNLYEHSFLEHVFQSCKADINSSPLLKRIIYKIESQHTQELLGYFIGTYHFVPNLSCATDVTLQKLIRNSACLISETFPAAEAYAFIYLAFGIYNLDCFLVLEAKADSLPVIHLTSIEDNQNNLKMMRQCAKIEATPTNPVSPRAMHPLKYLNVEIPHAYVHGDEEESFLLGQGGLERCMQQQFIDYAVNDRNQQWLPILQDHFSTKRAGEKPSVVAVGVGHLSGLIESLRSKGFLISRVEEPSS